MTDDDRHVRAPTVVDGEVFRQAFERFAFEHADELRRWVTDVLTGPVVNAAVLRDAAVLRKAVEQIAVEREDEVRRWIMEVLGRTLELGHFADWSKGGADRSAEAEQLLKSLVRTELAASPLAKTLAGMGRSLGLFPSTDTSPPLPPAAVHARSWTGRWSMPEARGEELASFLARDPHPIPTAAEREEYFGERHFDYWLSGLEDFLRVRATLERHGRRLAAPFSYLDFGCASGRVLRHFLCQVSALEPWGTDLNEGHVNWLLEHLPRPLKAFQCTTLPFLPLEDESLDLVTAFSVFTHIDEYEVTWLLELRRVLKPGGLAYLTVHSDDTWKLMKPGLAAYDHTFANRHAIHEYTFGPELFRGAMPRDKTVFRWRSDDLYNNNVFLSRRHLREVWGRFYDLLEIVPRGSGYQDVIVLRKPG